MKQSLVVGLTGSIACGKTSVAKIFESFGAEVIDVDCLGHQLLKDNSKIRGKVIESFGNRILDESREIDRSKLGRMVFSNHKHLNTLNSIIHPPLIELTKAMIKEKQSSGDYNVIVIDAALLIELNLTYMVDSVVVVYVDEKTQIQRLMERGLTREDAIKRIRSQMPSYQKARFADFIIYTYGSIEFTREQVKRVWDNLSKMMCA